MTKFYVEFKTWFEGTVDVPWPYVIFEETDDYRARHDLSIHCDKKIIKSAFLSFDDSSVKAFFNKYVNAVIVGSVLETDNSDLILTMLKQHYGYCELLGFCEIDKSNEERINLIMADAKK